MTKSGREKTNFAVACSLLSQYIKEKRGVPELALGMAAKGKSEGVRPPPTSTMSLLPGADVDAGDESKTGDDDAVELFPQRAGLGSAQETHKSPQLRHREQQEKAGQLTIFYDGKVLAFDNIPAEKAKGLMQFACKSATIAHNFGLYAPPPAPAVDSKTATESDNTNQKPAGATVSNIPIAPRASLQRFLEKRKHRISTAAPYQVSGTAATASPVKKPKPEESKSWLGLVSQPSTPSISLNSDSNW